METTALPPTEREKIRWGYMGKQVVGTATAERQTARRRVFTEKIP